MCSVARGDVPLVHVADGRDAHVGLREEVPHVALALGAHADDAERDLARRGRLPGRPSTCAGTNHGAAPAANVALRRPRRVKLFDAFIAQPLCQNGFISP